MENIDLNKVKKCLCTEFIGKNIVYFQEIDSTNDYAFALLQEHTCNYKEAEIKKLHGTLVIAEIQNKGRGRLGRKWVSPPGGLWFTIILISELDLKYLQNITLISAFAVADSLKNHFDIDTKIKWPNDIYYRDLKVGGILVESEKSDDKIFLISGFGINVNLGPDEAFPDRSRAGSLNWLTGKDLDREILLCRILEIFEQSFMTFTAENKFSPIFRKMAKYIIY